MKEVNQEATQGRFGPQVEQTMFRHPNIHVVAGIPTKSKETKSKNGNKI